MEAREYVLMDEVEHSMWWYRALHARLLDALAGSNGPLLDAGCGTGGFLTKLRLARPDIEASGLEYDPSAAVRAAEKSGASVKQGTVNDLPFHAGEFGVVISADVLCHQGVVPAQALSEFRRVLRSGGCCIINMPAFQWMYSAHDKHVHTRERITSRQMVAWFRGAGFIDVEAKYWNSLLFPLMVLRRKVFAVKSDAASDVSGFPAWQNRALFAATEIERRLLFPMPFGGSVMGIGRAP